MIKYLFPLVVLCFSCKETPKEDLKAKEIIQKCVETHGGKAYEAFDVSFDFRKFNVRIKQNKASYIYERKTEDSLKNSIHDVLTNDVFERRINNKIQVLTSKDASRFKEATNSIAYFVLLPYKLLDAAVHLEYAGTTTLENNQYDKIKVSFQEEGGGQDHSDIFCYWINQKTHTLDYLSYDNGGPRFRKAINRQQVAGIVFQDYENYEIADTTLLTSDYDKVFDAGKAKLLSKIEQKNYISR